MFIAIKTALASLKKKKIQNILIGIIIMLISTLLYIGIAMVAQSAPFEKMHKRANATESLLIVPKVGDGNNVTSDWYDKRDEVEAVLSYETFMVNVDYYVQDEKKTELIFLTEFLENDEYDLFYYDNKTIASAPVGNEMLINYNFAKGRELEVGDIVTFKNNEESYEFVISGLIVDPHFSVPFINPDRCFVQSGFFKENNIANETSIVSIKYYDIESIDDKAIFDEYNKDIGKNINPTFLDYETIKLTYSLIMSLISEVLIAVSILILIIVIFIIRSTVQNLILQQFRQIGIKKAIGYTNNQIRNSIFLVYCVIGFAASSIGALIGLPIRRAINAGITADLQVGLDASMDIYMIITIVAVVAMIFIFSWIATKKIVFIRPVQAIKYGMEERKAGTNAFSILSTKNRPLSLLLATKQLLSNKRKTITTVLLITLLVYVALVLGNMGTTIADSNHFASYLFGMNIGDYTVVADDTYPINQTMQKIKTLDDVDSVVYFQNSLSDSFTKKDGDAQTIGGLIIYGDIPDDFILLSSGRQPEGGDEIVISSETEKESGKSVGDYIVIDSKGIEKTYLIAGACNTISNGGFAYVLFNENTPDKAVVNGGFYWVYTKAGAVDFEKAEKDVKVILGDGAKVSEFDSNVTNVISTLEAFPMVIRLLLIVFLIVGGIIITNATIMDINNSVKAYGIMKAVGFSNLIIARILVIRTAIITSVGILVGFSLNMLTMNSLMRAVFSITPFFTIDLPVLLDIPKSLLIVALFGVVSIAATMLPSRKIANVSPKQLVTE